MNESSEHPWHVTGRHAYFSAVVLIGGAAWIVYYLSTAALGFDKGLMAVFTAAVAITTAYYQLRHSRWVKQVVKERGPRIAQLAKRHKWQYVATSDRMADEFEGLMWPYQWGIEHKALNYTKSSQWSYTEVQYVARDFSSATPIYNMYYAAMKTSLDAELPTVFFDSRHARGRKYKFRIVPWQRRRVGHDFNKIFTVYYPQNASSLMMQFLTPDLQAALIQASNYDIEFSGNRICLYGALMEEDGQLRSMEQALDSLKKCVLKQEIPPQLIEQTKNNEQKLLRYNFLETLRYTLIAIIGLMILIGFMLES